MTDFLDRPGGTNDVLVNGYAVTMKECDDRCGGMHGGGCTCGAESYNRRVRKEAESKPAKKLPDKIPLTYYQLTQRMAQADKILEKLENGKIPPNPVHWNRQNDRRYRLVYTNQQIKAARKLLSLK